MPAADELDEVQESDDEASEDGNAVDGNVATTMQLDDEEDAEGVKVTEIDAYWLQRAISEAYGKTDESLDAPAAQTLASKVLRLMDDCRVETELESQLVDLLGFDRFQLIKVRFVRWNVQGALVCRVMFVIYGLGFQFKTFT